MAEARAATGLAVLTAPPAGKVTGGTHGSYDLARRGTGPYQRPRPAGMLNRLDTGR